ncbi:MAG: hypothetical protein EZS28_016199 [Streblomastix strix]|uniref:Uncharacterized protein n=1 Tax=Streblomastix strix TaxID=222440 RepID=A0A5J4W014_9EUKA|nr:MAG: hypothetical protein EZS28_016199 [Streblomastix strix]
MCQSGELTVNDDELEEDDDYDEDEEFDELDELLLENRDYDESSVDVVDELQYEGELDGLNQGDGEDQIEEKEDGSWDY